MLRQITDPNGTPMTPGGDSALVAVAVVC